jgi:DNA recombination protein RmuC
MIPWAFGAAVLVLLALVGVTLVVVLARRGGNEASAAQATALQLLQQQVDALRAQFQDGLSRLVTDLHQQASSLKDSVSTRLAENAAAVQTSGRQVGENLSAALNAVGEVREQLGALREGTERIRELGQDVSGLKHLLQAPQFRGGLGEFLLEDLLGQLFPREHYAAPYTFESGERVDAALRLRQGLIPIDSKFPLDSFRRLVEAEAAGADNTRAARRQFRSDLRRHVDDIARKYVRPRENFYDFALMYIPAESVYYEAIIREDNAAEDKGLFEYALERRVIPVSPNTLFAYLQVIVLGLKGLKVEERADQILKGLGQLRIDLEKVEASFGKLGSQLQFASANYAESLRRLSEFGQHLSLLGALGEDSETLEALLARRESEAGVP